MVLIMENEIYIEIPVSIIDFNGKPAVLLRKIIYDKDKVEKFTDYLLKNDSIQARVYFPDLFKVKIKMLKLGLIKEK